MKPLARWNTGLGMLVTVMVALRLLLWPLAQPACARCNSPNRPVGCGVITHLAVNYLNDEIPLPAAFEIPTGTLSGGLARFKVYGVAADANYFVDFTPYAEPGTGHLLRVRIRATPGSHDVSGEIHFHTESNINWITYRPRRSYRCDRTALITFEFNCGCRRDPAQTFTTTFALKIPGRPPSGTPDQQSQS